MRQRLAQSLHGAGSRARPLSRALGLLVCLLVATSAARAASRSHSLLPPARPPAAPAFPAAAAPGAAESADWLARVQGQIAAREYRATRSAQGLQAPNRRHELRTWFGPEGIRVHDRSAPGAPQLLALSAASLGRGAERQALPPGEVASSGARVEIRRPGLVEWYENSPAGLEQGFTLAERPAGAGPLELELALRGAEAALRGEGVVFETATGRRLRYGNLVARDARGLELPARFELASRRALRLVVDDARAAYPLAIDPLLTATADAQLEGDQVAAALGQSVAGAGDVNGDGYADLIVGAYAYDAGESNEGAAFVFLGSATGIADAGAASAHAQLEADQIGAGMGYSVAGAGDVDGDGYADVIVGAYLYDAGLTDEGAAFVFLGSATGIADGNPATAAAQLGSDQESAFMGYRLAGAGDVDGDGYADVIVGSVLYDAGQTDEGAAFVFLGSATGIADGSPASAHAQLESDQANAQLGHSVAGAGDVNGDGYADVVASAIAYDAGESDEGAAFVYLGSATGIADGNPASAHAQLEADQANAGMGYSLAGAGDVDGDGYADLIASATSYSAGQAGEGAAWIFLGSASGIADGNPASAAAQLESNQMGAAFGQSVSGAGDVNGDGYADVVVGAVTYDAGESDEGAAFVFLGSATGIADGNPASAHAQLESDQADALFGRSVAGAGDLNGDGYADVAAGALFYAAGEALEGAAFVYLGGASGIASGGPASAATRIESDQLSAELGASVAGAGDVNGDGHADLIVGAPRYDAGQLDEGAAFVLLGSASGIADASAAAASAQLESDQPGASFGASVSGAGDVNGDGHADLIVGAPHYDAGHPDEGAAFVYLGSATGIADAGAALAAARLESDQAGARLGASVAGAGDVNGDGYSDVIAGAPSYDAGQLDEGAAFLFLGGAAGVPSGAPSAAAARFEANQTGADLGASVAGAGDVDGDGYPEIVAGAPRYDAGELDEGAAFVFRGRANGTPLNAMARLEADQIDAGFGQSVAGAGDVNGDGYADLIVGAPRYDAGESDEGAAFVFLGSVSGVADADPASAAAQLESDQAGAALGASVAGAGDVNGDGHADVIVGAAGFTSGQALGGAAFVFEGSASGIAGATPASAAAQLESDQAGAALGASVAGAGDVNGDGYADVVAGAPGYGATPAPEGAAFVFSGNGSGRSALPQQLRGDASGVPVQPWGLSQAGDGFEVALTATPPAGRALARLEIEACAPGIPFGDAGCLQQLGPAWSAVPAGAQGLRLTQLVSGLPPEVRYRWRARVLYAPLSATQPGVTPPAKPAHGPWRRLQAQSVEADLRVVPEPGAWLSLGSGFALAAALARRRARRRGRAPA